MCNRCHTLLAAAFVLSVTACVHAQDRRPGNAPASFDVRSFKAPSGETLRYSLFVPKEVPKGKRLPLVICLHGSGGGTHAARVLADPEQQKKRPCFLLAPACEGKGNRWVKAEFRGGRGRAVEPELMATLDAVVREHAIDPARVYLTGQSMGGVGTWGLIAAHPRRFAAAVPVCGLWNPGDARKMAEVPVWAFHGARDAAVPVSGSRDIVEALRKAGASPRYTEYPDLGHGIWGEAYATEALWEWVFAQKRPADRIQPDERLAEWKLLEPAWLSPVVHRESSVLLQTRPGGPITARLAFPAAEVLEVSAATRQHPFDLKRDVSLSADGLVLTVTGPGPVERIKASDFFPPKDAPNSYRHRAGHPEQNLLYRPGRWFHDRDVEVTYRRREAPAPPAKTAGTLPKTRARLEAGKPLTLGVSGDSISTGLDASALTKAPPNQPGYPDLVAAQLRASYGSDVALKNRAVAGWSVAHGVKDIDRLLAEKPHLVVVAYGMNDVGRRDPKWFGKQAREIVERVRKADPDAEVILVSPMLGHAEWVHTPREMFAKYRDELKALTGPGVALADVTAAWEMLLRHKHDLDLTGNGLNHPNDFGHRLYAQAILALLVNTRKAAAK